MATKLVIQSGVFVLVMDQSFVSQGGDQAFSRVYEPLLASQVRFIVDMELLDSVDSTRLASIVIFYKRATERECRIVFCGANRTLSDVFMVTRLDRVLEIVETREDAMKVLTRSKSDT